METFWQVDKVINQQINIHFWFDKSNQNDKNQITTKLGTGGNRQILRLMDWLYEDANYYIQRKYDKYLELKQWCADVNNRLVSEEKHTNQYG